MRITVATEVAAPPEAVWDSVSDPAKVLHVMSGITRWEPQHAREGPGGSAAVPASAPAVGLGARYRMLMRVGSAEVGSLIEIVEFCPPFDLAWTSVTGVDQRGRWRLRPRPHDGRGPRTHVEFRLAYGVAGAGLLGWLAEQVAAPQVSGHLRSSLAQLKRQVEHDETRRAAAERRRARAAAAEAAAAAIPAAPPPG
ncbi:MAG: hypothetical protein AVDCRST_MAG13-1094 [uncultured Solirubrobacteraceae bacterium]|uniref:Coenzyme Q-binding protein COQ10 START domain-containing protein n=1 Tax=uncultured Solirubrobacteraceae bacterium TaxID=1162706 RepID=A0A6J4RR74_9ACTN|nr:MAG: hypothetical protein AVDCRST_MAG13-1094 [uncultured Solirubrobacteraceae bacterium]